jgi:PAS domain S-box-containing protein
LGTSLADYVIDSQKSFFEQSLKNLNKKKFDCSFLTKKHGILNISISISKGLWKDSDNLCVLLTDVTPLKRAQRLVEASESISKILSETSTISVACQNIIDLLKHYLDWEVLIVWLWNKEKQVLNCVEIAHIQNINIEEFTQKTKELEIGIGSRIISNPVHVWNSCRPIWIEDITEDPSFIRREQAAKNGLRGCIAFPFFKESHLMGVIELFRRTPFNEHVDEQILNLITSIGIEVGIYIQRHIEEEGKIEFPIVLKYISNGILTVDKSGIIRSWNKAAEAIFGWSAQEMIGSSAKILFPPEKLHEFDEILNALIAGKSIEHFYTTRINKQGELVFVENSYGLITNPFGEFTSICVVVNDISMKKNYEKTIAQITDRFKNFISMTEEWIWEIDHLGHFIFSNSAIYKILGYTAEEVIGNNIVRFISFDNRKKIEDQLKMSTAQKEGWVHEIICFTNKNGKESWLDSNVSPLINESNQLIGFRGASRDITESLNLEKVKNEFISIVSHELKNPLASIYGALSLLKGKQLNPDQKNELLISAQRNSELLTNIINDITDVERLQLGKLNFNFKKIILNDVIHESIASSDILAHKSDVKIETIKSLPDVAVRGDYQRLMQVML